MRDAATYRFPVPGLTRHLLADAEAPDHVRGAARAGGTA
ncbi:hypothetical protein FIU89_14120 [Roseovarius sp. THAF27]|nr:hypothetical protein FIU89_14120 [Roseovarius sp. THAF27]QFT99102.1 hypothetical protein FIU85_17440 [Roseovarius sp. THAF8]